MTIALVGHVPLFAGAARICLVAPLLGFTVKGERRMRHAA
jgi:hypothetical protein